MGYFIIRKGFKASPLVPIIQQLTEWANNNLKSVMKHRAAFERENR